MKSDGFWDPISRRDGTRLALSWEPRVNEPGEVFAELSPELVALLGDPQNRQWLREALVSRYFAEHREALLGKTLPEPCTAEGLADYGEPHPGRSAAFRKIILEIYDHRCTACGIQIRIGSPPLSLVEAAHLLPFAESRNDHPTNGLALCKNHHWAMDNHLIAPSPDGVWRHSSRIIPHRSRGEQQLAELDGRQVIPPTELAFRPARPGLEYRYQKMREAEG